MGSGTAVAALVIVGILLVIIGIFASGNLALIGLGVAALVFAGAFQVMASRRS